MICPSTAIYGPSFVKAVMKLERLGFQCNQKRPIWIGEVECGECVDEDGIKKVVLVCRGERGCWVETRLAVPASLVLVRSFDAVLLELAKLIPYLPDDVIPSELKSVAKAVSREVPSMPKEYSFEALAEIAKAFLNKKKTDLAVPFSRRP